MFLNFLASVYFKFARIGHRRYLRKHNFIYLDEASQEIAAAHQEVADVMAKFSQDDFDGFEKAYLLLRQNDEILTYGQLKSGLILRRLGDIFYEYDMKAAQERFQALEEWWQKDKTAFASGIYAYCLYQRGWSKRGGGYSDDVTSGGLLGFTDYLKKMRQVLDDCDENTENSFIWNYVNYRYYMENCNSIDELNFYFDKFIHLDPDNLYYYQQHSFRLSPRWYGNSMQDVEDFARYALSQTKDRFGAGVYAVIYALQASLDQNEFEDSFCDIHLVDQGFEDLYARFGGQTCVNYHIYTLYWGEAYQPISALIQNRLSTIICDAWSDCGPDVGRDFANSAITYVGKRKFPASDIGKDDGENAS